MEYELLDTGIFDSDRYFDVFVEYAKNTPDDILIQISVLQSRPRGRHASCPADALVSQYVDLVAGDAEAGPFRGSGQERHSRDGSRARRTGRSLSLLRVRKCLLLFTENETNNERIFGTSNASRYRQGRNQRLRGRRQAGCGQPGARGNKGDRALPAHGGAGKTATIWLRLSNQAPARHG